MRAPRLALVGVLAGLTGGVSTIVSASTAAAAVTVNVPCSPAVPGGGPAGLVAAINHANAHGGGTIGLASRCTYSLGPTGDDGSDGLPVVRARITINGNASTVARSHAPGTAAFRIFEVDGPGNLTLDSLRVTGGRSSGGGGILDDNGGTLTLDASRVDDNAVTNAAKAFGGGISVDNGSTLVLNNTRVDHNFIGDSPLSGAGGVYENNGSRSTVTASRIDHNSVTASTIAVGGGVAVDGGNGSRTMALRASVVDDNVVQTTGSGAQVLARGGGVESNGTAVTLITTQVTANTARAPGGSAFGGGIHSLTSANLSPSPDGLLALSSSQVTGNSVSGSRAGGGGISNQVGTARTTSSQVSGNTVSGSNASGSDGGGIENLLLPNAGAPVPSLIMATTQVNANTATAPGAPSCGGGVFNSGQATASSAAITGNTATGSPAHGGGIFNARGFTLTRSVVAGNAPDNRVDSPAARCER